MRIGSKRIIKFFGKGKYWQSQYVQKQEGEMDQLIDTSLHSLGGQKVIRLKKNLMRKSLKGKMENRQSQFFFKLHKNG